MTDLNAINTIVPEFVDAINFFVPVDNSLGASWTDVEPPDNIERWGTGAAAVGFERQPENFRDLIKTSVTPPTRAPVARRCMCGYSFH